LGILLLCIAESAAHWFCNVSNHCNSFFTVTNTSACMKRFTLVLSSVLILMPRHEFSVLFALFLGHCKKALSLSGSGMRAISVVVLTFIMLISTTMFFAYRNLNNRLSYSIVLPTIGDNGEFSTAEINRKGRAYVINVFSSWCSACIKEHKTWEEITREEPIDLYGIDYIDIEENAVAWLEKHGNPYLMVAADYSGKSTKALGVTGVPETFVFNKKGEMVLHLSGMVTKEIWHKHISGLVHEK
ncbi:MAG: redoxin family protein, partial [Aaplasma endosymbiont of Hyalomma asiaticum]